MKESVNRFTLIENDEFWNYEHLLNRDCPLCGNKIEFCGFDFFFDNIDKFICKKCAATQAPELIEIQENALFYLKIITSRKVSLLHGKITETINSVFKEVSE